jgi:hypothetical protein
MPSLTHFRSIRFHFGLPLVCALMGLGAATVHATWSAVGTVKNASSTALSGVAITVKDSSANIKTTTDANGTFVIGTITGIMASEMPSDFSVRQNGNELQIAFPGQGTLDLQLVDIAGSTLWKGSAPLADGYANAVLPASAHHGAAILRVTLGSQVVYQPLTLLGAAGIHVTPRIAARSMATYATLIFKKVGYADTSYTMNAATQTGVNVVMRDSTIHIIIPSTCQLPPSPNSGSGSFTNYSFGQGSWQENGHYALACGYHGFETGGQSSDKVNNLANPQYFVAIPGYSPSNFTNVAMCGACVELTGQNGTKVVATIADECPEYKDDGSVSNQPCINNPNGHLDIGYPAFSQLGFSVGNPSGTSWKYVKCPVTGNVVVRIKPGNTDQLYVENTILPIKDVTINGSSSTHLSYGAWQLSKKAAGATVVIKDYSDRTITYTVPGSPGTDQDQNTGLQFPACQ